VTFMRAVARVFTIACMAVAAAGSGLPATAAEGDTAGHAAELVAGLTVAIDDKVSVFVPTDMTREQRSLGARGDMLTLADGSDAMVLVVYRQGGADKAPSAAEALQVHAEELERALGPATRQPARRRVLGRDQDAVLLSLTRDTVPRDAWVVAFEARGRTIVVSAVLVRGSPNELAVASVLKGIRVL